MSTWILLRGLTRESRHWGDFPELLRAEITGARVIALDLPGNGDLNAMTSPATILDMASLCRAQLARQGVPPPIACWPCRWEQWSRRRGQKNIRPKSMHVC